MSLSKAKIDTIVKETNNAEDCLRALGYNQSLSDSKNIKINHIGSDNTIITNSRISDAMFSNEVNDTELKKLSGGDDTYESKYKNIYNAVYETNRPTINFWKENLKIQKRDLATYELVKKVSNNSITTGGVALPLQSTFTLATIIESKFAKTSHKAIFTPEITPKSMGITHIRWNNWTPYGETGPLSFENTSAKVSDAYVNQSTSDIVQWSTSYQFGVQDIAWFELDREGYMTGANTIGSRINYLRAKLGAVKLNMEIAKDVLYLLGDKKYNIKGLMNNPDVPINSTLGANWSSSTSASEILADIVLVINNFIAASGNNFTPNSMTVSSEVHAFLNGKNTSTLYNMTIYQWLAKMGVKEVVVSPRLAKQGTDGKGVILFQDKEAQCLKSVLTNDLQPLVPVWSNGGNNLLNVRTTGIGGVKVIQPSGVLLCNSINGNTDANTPTSYVGRGSELLAKNSKAQKELVSNLKKKSA